MRSKYELRTFQLHVVWKCILTQCGVKMHFHLMRWSKLYGITIVSSVTVYKISAPWHKWKVILNVARRARCPACVQRAGSGQRRRINANILQPIKIEVIWKPLLGAVLPNFRHLMWLKGNFKCRPEGSVVLLACKEQTSDRETSHKCEHSPSRKNLKWFENPY